MFFKWRTSVIFAIIFLGEIVTSQNRDVVDIFVTSIRQIILVTNVCSVNIDFKLRNVQSSDNQYSLRLAMLHGEIDSERMQQIRQLIKASTVSWCIKSHTLGRAVRRMQQQHAVDIVVTSKQMPTNIDMFFFSQITVFWRRSCNKCMSSNSDQRQHNFKFVGWKRSLVVERRCLWCSSTCSGVLGVRVSLQGTMQLSFTVLTNCGWRLRQNSAVQARDPSKVRRDVARLQSRPYGLRCGEDCETVTQRGQRQNRALAWREFCRMYETHTVPNIQSIATSTLATKNSHDAGKFCVEECQRITWCGPFLSRDVTKGVWFVPLRLEKKKNLLFLWGISPLSHWVFPSRFLMRPSSPTPQCLQPVRHHSKFPPRIMHIRETFQIRLYFQIDGFLTDLSQL